MKQDTLVAGIDIGSRSIELVVLNHGQVVESRRLPTTYDPLAQCLDILASLPHYAHHRHRLRPQTRPR